MRNAQPCHENMVRSTSNQEDAKPQTRMMYLSPSQPGSNGHERCGKARGRGVGHASTDSHLVDLSEF